jgi:hypothetical protein
MEGEEKVGEGGEGRKEGKWGGRVGEGKSLPQL